MIEVRIIGKLIGEPVFWNSKYRDLYFGKLTEMSLLLVNFLIEQDNGSILLSRANSRYYVANAQN